MKNGVLEILLVEDNADHAELIARRLTSDPSPRNVTTVRSLAEAREFLDARTPDLVVVDYLLPDGNGTDLLEPDGPCPVIVVTSHGDEELAVRSLKGGAVDYVSKSGPTGMTEISRAIERALREWDLRSEKLAKEQELRELNARLTAVLDSTDGLAIMTLGEDGGIGSVNRGGELMLGWSAAELCGNRTPFDLHPEPQATELRDLVAGEGLAAALARLERDAVWTYRHRDGREIPVAIRISPIRGGAGHVLTATDISERLEAERRVARAERFAALGRLAGGIAHDFNNILGAIVSLAGASELALESGDIDEARQHQGEIVKAGQQAGAMVERMLTFGRQELHEGVSAVGTVFADCLQLAGLNLPPSISPEVSVAPSISDVRVSPTSLRQVVLNLVLNAGQAAGPDGTVALAAAEVEIAEPRRCASCGESFSGQLVELAVSDSGPGVPEPLRATIFEPFVSARADASGTGIGLSVVHNIVHGAGGHIELETGAGGSRFSVFLPPAAERAAGAVPGVEPTSAEPTQRILFVEDDVRVQRSVATLLSRLGYDLLATSSAEEALEAFHGDPDGFDLVLTDDRMPGKSGLELARELAALRPGLPIIISSGHRAVTEDDAAAIGSCQLLVKPYRVQELRRVLDAAFGSD